MGTQFLFLLFLLTCANLPPSSSDPEDEACLTNLKESLQDPKNSLQNWTKTTFKNPCSGFTSYLQGATCNNGRIYKLSLTNLSLKGSISPYLSNCTNLQSLDLSSNSLTGPIPPDLQSLLNLAVLNLSSNRLSGQIPPQLAFCAYLNVIDLHENLLTGMIPQQLGLLLRLSAFDVSSNRLSGPIPGLLGNRNGNLPRFNASSFEGNKDLYGYPLGPVKVRRLSVRAIVGIGLGSGFLSLVISFSVVCVWLKVREERVVGEEGKIVKRAGIILVVVSEIEEFNTGSLNSIVSIGLRMKKQPVVFLHGGPGGGTSPSNRRFFDPDFYRIILCDQRGAGRSTPHACLEDNTTWDLINDIEKLREHLDIPEWQVFGGSWGSTLALAYSQSHPEKVTGMVLRGIFLLRKKELDWFYEGGAAAIFPDAWEPFRDLIPENERGSFISAYSKRLNSDNIETQGRYDVCCPMMSAWDLHKAWPEAELKVIPDAGHSANEPGIAVELVTANEKLKIILKTKGGSNY
ncbi:hypothetical protein HHK36_008253 [Tetracentron sinense]|uniref:Proline iminopeptidase n=1 Tax=Tetracentron sinense TaxID=13715 RepID=A0A835DJ53_TETSI|nr:hypothetical protein HHK36_008253 [Tetracentron sinense]